MAQTRKDLRGRVLRKGESQRRSDERYVYTYTDPLGRRKYVYAQDLVTLREKEAQLMKDQMDGLDIYVAGKATVNFVFDRYMSLKNNLKPTTKSNYLYMYDRFIRDTFGKRNIAEIKYSDVVQFYNHLTKKQELKINTLETIHTLLHPTFQLAVRDDIIRKNPTDGVMAELRKLRHEDRCETCTDDSTAESIYGIYCCASDLFSLVADFYDFSWNRVPDWRSFRASMGRH